MFPQTILDKVHAYMGPDPLIDKMLLSCFDFAKRAHESQHKTSGDPFINHIVDVTQILSDIKADLPTLCAGLLHDIKRSQKKHAEKGAIFIQETLRSWDSFHPKEVLCIACAVKNHEAFTKQQPSKTPEDELVSNCLYDADKFRWGPDNFMYTVWDMIESAGVPFSVFVSHYPKGMMALQKIRTSFRTRTGMKYGPQFIDTGLAIGQELYEVIQRDFSFYQR